MKERNCFNCSYFYLLANGKRCVLSEAIVNLVAMGEPDEAQAQLLMESASGCSNYTAANTQLAEGKTVLQLIEGMYAQLKKNARFLEPAPKTSGGITDAS